MPDGLVPWRVESIKTHNAWAYERIILRMQWKAHSTCDWVKIELPALQVWALHDVLQDNHLQDAEMVIRTAAEAAEFSNAIWQLPFHQAAKACHSL